MTHSQTKIRISETVRWWVITAALLALFLGAMDSLIMSAVMPTILADLGGLAAYSWVYTAYFLARVVALPIFGKLADLYKVKVLFIISIGLFLVSSIAAGVSPNMVSLIIARVFQGIAAGGNFALVYIVLSDMAPPGKRAKTLSLASFIWGAASLLGPTVGGVIVTWFSWRWVFFINIPASLFSMVLIARYLVELRQKKSRVDLDLAGVAALSVTILALLSLLMLGGRDFRWVSPVSISLMSLTLVSGVSFYFFEKRAREPILALEFFRIRGFSIGNLSVFLSSFTIFSFFAYAPLFIQGALGKTPLQVGMSILFLTLGWSLGSILTGQVLNRIRRKTMAVIGAVILTTGCGLTLTFTYQTSLTTCFGVFLVVGLGTGFVAMSTILVVQNALGESDLGVATTSNQFARSLGGTIGIGVGGGVVMAGIQTMIDNLGKSGALDQVPVEMVALLQNNVERLFQPEFQSQIIPQLQDALQRSVGESVALVFWISFIVSWLCLAACLFLPGKAALRTSN